MKIPGIVLILTLPILLLQLICTHTNAQSRSEKLTEPAKSLPAVQAEGQTSPRKGSPTLEEQLKQVTPETLAELAHRDGDAARGAIVFFQGSMACSKCHAVDENQPTTLGPSLVKQVSTTVNPKEATAASPQLESTAGKQQAQPLTDVAIVQAILEPSQSISSGYEAVTVLKTDGQVLTGLLVDRTESQVALRDSQGVLSTVLAEDIEQIAVHPQSLMPAGQVNQLTSRQQFLDLLKYLYEIRDGGSPRARELQPAEALLALKLPEYESRIDHAGFIRDWNNDSLERGEAIYQRVCANCHGTHDQVGSLPTSLRFAEGKFKNGGDPLSMYGTLTRGFGFMPAQSWMVPSQKYDVIHYIREKYLKQREPSQLADVLLDISDEYLASLPAGDSRGPAPSTIEAWSAMDYGMNLTHCYEIPGEALNIAYKGIAIRLDSGAGGVSRGNQWMIFDTDTLRTAAGWHVPRNEADNDENSRFIDWRDIQMNGEHGIHPRVVGDIVFSNPNGPGWAEPQSGTWRDDQRVQGRDGRRYGPLPSTWGKFQGIYHHGNKVLLSYRVGQAEILELPSQVAQGDGTLPPAFVRTLNVGPRSQELVLQVAEVGANSSLKTSEEGSPSPNRPSTVATSQLIAGILRSNASITWSIQDGRLCVTLPVGDEPLKFVLWLTENQDADTSASELSALGQQIDAELAAGQTQLSRLTQGGPTRWGQRLEVPLVATSTSGPFAIEQIVAPDNNPWLAQMRFSGLDFFSDGSLAVCTWDGDVWRVSIEEERSVAVWQRMATGLYQPLGLKIVNDQVYLTCRDQLAVLHDLNGDGETDFYQCLNNDHQVTEHFHEFAMGLQLDAEGNFYYAKSGRHALEAIVPHHGTLLRVSADGEDTDILATGFRAANGVCINPDGSFLVTDQEGFWNPKNRINWVTLNRNGKPKFYGNMFGYHDVTDTADTAMEPPLCWITNQFDRSPGELLWVDDRTWKSLDGALLNLSYGTGKVFLVLHEEVEGLRQGGMLELPIPTFPTGVMRGRFSPHDHQLYLCGMFAWAGDATTPGGLYRMRPTDQPMALPTEMHVKSSGIYLTFAEALSPESIAVGQVAVKTWSLKRTRNYGSDHYNEQTLRVDETQLSADGRTVRLVIDGLSPTWCMEIQYDFLTQSGVAARGVIHNTVHRLGPEIKSVE